jgi:hypothetical protein
VALVEKKRLKEGLPAKHAQNVRLSGTKVGDSFKDLDQCTQACYDDEHCCGMSQGPDGSCFRSHDCSMLEAAHGWDTFLRKDRCGDGCVVEWWDHVPTGDSTAWLNDATGFFSQSPRATTCAPAPLNFNFEQVAEAMKGSKCCSESQFTLRAKCKYSSDHEERLGVAFGKEGPGFSMAQVLINGNLMVDTTCDGHSTACPGTSWSGKLRPDEAESDLTVIFATKQKGAQLRLVNQPAHPCAVDEFTLEFFTDSGALIRTECAPQAAFAFPAAVDQKDVVGQLRGNGIKVVASGSMTLDGGKHRFGSRLEGGAVALEVDGQQVLDTDEKTADTQWGREFDLADGLHEVRATFSSSKSTDHSMKHSFAIQVARTPDCSRGEWKISLFGNRAQTEDSWVSTTCRSQLSTPQKPDDVASASFFRAEADWALDEGNYRFEVNADDVSLHLDGEQILEAHLSAGQDPVLKVRRSRPIAVAGPEAGPLDFIGCFAAPTAASFQDGGSTSKCQSMCQGQPFGIRGGECVCGVSVAAGRRLHDDACGVVCDGEDSLVPRRLCGAAESYAVFRELGAPAGHGIVLKGALVNGGRSLPQFKLIQDATCGANQYAVEWFLAADLTNSYSVSCHESIDFDWRSKAPAQLPVGHPRDHFSMRATGSVDVGANGDFQVVNFGASRVMVNGKALDSVSAGDNEIQKSDPMRLAGTVNIVVEHKATATAVGRTQLDLSRLPTCALGQFRVDVYKQPGQASMLSSTCVEEDQLASFTYKSNGKSFKAIGQVAFSSGGLYRFGSEKPVEMSLLADTQDRFLPMSWANGVTQPLSETAGLHTMMLSWAGKNAPKKPELQLVKKCADGQWLVSFYSKSGDAAYSYSGARCMDSLDFSWGEEGPAEARVAAGSEANFRILARAEMDFDEEADFRFATTSSERVSVMFDGAVAANSPGRDSSTYISGAQRVKAGTHVVMVSANVTQKASLKVDIMQDPTCTAGQLKVEFFAPDGDLAFVECHGSDKLTFTGADFPKMNKWIGAYSMKATGTMSFAQGHYRFNPAGNGHTTLRLDEKDVAWGSLHQLEGPHALVLSVDAASMKSPEGFNWVHDCDCAQGEWCLEWYQATSGKDKWVSSSCSKDLDIVWKNSPATGTDRSVVATIDMEMDAGNVRFQTNSVEKKFSPMMRIDGKLLDFVEVSAVSQRKHGRRSVKHAVQSGVHKMHITVREAPQGHKNAKGVKIDFMQDAKCVKDQFHVEWFLGNVMDEDHSWSTTCEPAIDWDWSHRRPALDVSEFTGDSVNFRATGHATLETGTFRFSFINAGSQLKVDGKRVLGYTNAGTQWTDPLDMKAGVHELVFEQSKLMPKKVVKLESHKLQDCPQDQYRVSYFQYPNFAHFAAAECMKNIDFNWGAGGPAQLNGKVDDFSVRVEGKISFNKGTYRLGSQSDNGATVFLDGEDVMSWYPQHAFFARYSTERQLDGVHDVRVDYVESSGDASMKLHIAQIPACAPEEFRLDFFRASPGTAPRNDADYVSSKCVTDISSKGAIKPPSNGARDVFSVVAKGTVNLAEGAWSFSSKTASSATLRLDGNDAIKAGSGNRNAVYRAAPLMLPKAAGVMVEYEVAELASDSPMELTWAKAGNCAVTDFAVEWFRDTAMTSLAKTSCVPVSELTTLANGKSASVVLGAEAPKARNLFMRATGTVDLGAGEYRFRLAEKNAQFFLDGKKIALKSQRHSKPWSEETHIAEGLHKVQVVLAHRTSTSVANRLVLETVKNPGCAEGDWQVDFMSSPVWGKAGEGDWLVSSCHSKLNRDAASLAPANVPAAALRDGAFTVRASLKMNFAKGQYRLGLEDAGGKLAVDGVEVLGLSLASSKKSHLRFSHQVSLQGKHHLVYSWSAPHANSALKAFWVSEPECQKDQWLVEFYRTQERSSWLHSECHLASNDVKVDIPRQVQASFATFATDNSHLGSVWPSHGSKNEDRSLFVRVAGTPYLDAARHRFTSAGNDVFLRLDGTAVRGMIGHDGEFRSESIEVKPGDHLMESHFQAAAGTSVAFTLSSDSACKQGDFLVEWFPRGQSMAAANVLYTKCASEADIEQNLQHWLDRQNLQAVEQGLALRFTGQVSFQDGLYRFRSSTAGSAKTWVDDQLVIDFFGSSATSAERWSSNLQLSGMHQVRYEFRGSETNLATGASWERVPECGNCEWLLEYFSKPVFSETNFVHQQCLAGSKAGHLDFKESMVPKSIVGDFGIRASTNCKFAEGSYNFGVPAGQEVRLTVDGASLVDEAYSVTKGNTLWAKPYSLAAGDHRVTLEQHQSNGLAEGRVYWELAQK